MNEEAFDLALPEDHQTEYLRDAFSRYGWLLEGALRILAALEARDSVRTNSIHNKDYSTISVICEKMWPLMVKDLRSALLMACYGRLELRRKFSIEVFELNEQNAPKATFHWKWDPCTQNLEEW